MVDRVKILVGTNGRFCIISAYIGMFKTEQRYMMEDIPLNTWLPQFLRSLRSNGIKVTVRKLNEKE